MNVMWMFGNGFDKRQGLNTSYPDFYKSPYVQGNQTNNRIYQHIREDVETWADFEYQLGRMSFDVPELPDYSPEQFWDDIDEAYEDLHSYLQEQYNALRPKQTYRYTLPLDICSCFDLDQKNAYESWLRSGLNPQPGTVPKATANVVSLNYTSEAFYWPKQSSEQQYLFKTPGQFPCNITCNGTVFPHGTLAAGNLILGCDNPTQYNPAVFQGCEYRILKQRMIDMAELDRQRVLSSIDRQNLFLLFGLSCGKTDKIYWLRILEKLKINATCRLVIFDWRNTPKVVARTHYGRARYREHRDIFVRNEKCRNEFLSHADWDDETKERIRKQIFVATEFKHLFDPAAELCENIVRYEELVTV